MSLSVRIFLVYFLFVGLSGYFVVSTVMDEIRPGVRQSTEETLVDTANLLAEIVRDDVKAGTLAQSRFPAIIRAYGQRRPQASIWGIAKDVVSHRVYVTDMRGVVLLDSANEAVGQDYSHWNDVYLTLQGRYGARTTLETAGDQASSVMYVAAPILNHGSIIGVVSVAKPNRTLQPYIDRSQRRLAWLGGGLVVLGLVIGAMLSWWLSRALRSLADYAQTVSAGQRAVLPTYYGGELAQLAEAVEHMREQLEGKAYVERYVQTLTHELKSPIAAIRGAAELLKEPLPDIQRQHFAENIETESLRLQHLIERLLHLAAVEQRQSLDERVPIDLQALVAELLLARQPSILRSALNVVVAIADDLRVSGEPFLVRQALANLLDNALDFAAQGAQLRIAATPMENTVRISVYNGGDPIPDFALPRLTERFYSLPRPATGRKSTGLGLNFVQEVAQLHGGALEIRNVDRGVEAVLVLSAESPT